MSVLYSNPITFSETKVKIGEVFFFDADPQSNETPTNGTVIALQFEGEPFPYGHATVQEEVGPNRYRAVRFS